MFECTLFLWAQSAPSFPECHQLGRTEFLACGGAFCRARALNFGEASGALGGGVLWLRRIRRIRRGSRGGRSSGSGTCGERRLRQRRRGCARVDGGAGSQRELCECEGAHRVGVPVFDEPIVSGRRADMFEGGDHCRLLRRTRQTREVVSAEDPCECVTGVAATCTESLRWVTQGDSRLQYEGWMLLSVEHQRVQRIEPPRVCCSPPRGLLTLRRTSAPG